MLQISVQVSPDVTAIAWDIDGANAANSIAMDASQAAKQRVILSIRILKL